MEWFWNGGGYPTLISIQHEHGKKERQKSHASFARSLLFSKTIHHVIRMEILLILEKITSNKLQALLYKQSWTKQKKTNKTKTQHNTTQQKNNPST